MTRKLSIKRMLGLQDRIATSSQDETSVGTNLYANEGFEEFQTFAEATVAAREAAALMNQVIRLKRSETGTWFVVWRLPQFNAVITNQSLGSAAKHRSTHNGEVEIGETFDEYLERAGQIEHVERVQYGNVCWHCNGKAMVHGRTCSVCKGWGGLRSETQT